MGQRIRDRRGGLISLGLLLLFPVCFRVLIALTVNVPVDTPWVRYSIMADVDLVLAALLAAAAGLDRDRRKALAAVMLPLSVLVSLWLLFSGLLAAAIPSAYTERVVF